MERTTKKERNDILSTLLVGGILAVVVVVAAVIRWLETFTLDGTSVSVPFAGVPAEIAPLEGLASTVVGVTRADVVAQEVNAVSLISLALSVLIGAAASLAVIALFGALALQFLRGRFFDPLNPRLLDAAGWTLMGGSLTVYVLDTFGRNGVLAAAGLAEFSPRRGSCRGRSSRCGSSRWCSA